MTNKVCSTFSTLCKASILQQHQDNGLPHYNKHHVYLYTHIQYTYIPVFILKFV